MITSIVLIGSVTSEHYKSVRIDELRKGNKPRVHRVDDVAKFLTEQYLPNGECSNEELRQYEKLLEDVFEESIYQPNPVAFIVAYDTWCHWDKNALKFFVDNLAEGRYRATVWVAFSNPVNICEAEYVF